MKILKYIRVLIPLFILLLLNLSLLSQDPPEPPNNHGSSNNQPPGGAPIGLGTAFLIGLGVVYGGKKIYALLKNR